MVESIAGDGIFHVSDEVEVKEILPGLASERARLDLGEIDIPQCERAQRPEQRTRNIAGGENKGGLESFCLFRWFKLRPAPRPFEQKKPREVLPIVLDRFP